MITDWREQAKVAKLKYWHEKDVLPIETAAGLTKTMVPRNEITTDTYFVPKPSSDVHDYYRNFISAIKGEQDQYVTHDQMRIDLKIILAAFESAKKQRSVKINELKFN